MRITWIRDWLNHDPDKRNKITGIHLSYGQHCSNAYQCDCASKCKYRHSGRWLPNLYVSIRQFFEYKFHIILPWVIYIDKFSSDLSGTKTCPFQKPRLYTCWDCSWCSGEIDGPCLHPDYNARTMNYDDPAWGKYHRCVLFSPMPGVDRFNSITGEHIY